MWLSTISFVEAHPDCFERSLLQGHVTGSAWIVSPDRREVVLIHHRKLDRWFQPGGHADGNPDIAAVAMQEAQEETGLHDLRFVKFIDDVPAIFDIDVHPIPERDNVPAHLHYDIRFLVEANKHQPFGRSGEIKAIHWANLEKVISYNNEKSMQRMAEKTQMLAKMYGLSLK